MTKSIKGKKSFIADLHIHSRYSRSTSPDMCLESLWRWAQIKGVTVLGTGDFTHPAWSAEMKQKLVPAKNGLYTLNAQIAETQLINVPRACRAPVWFMPTVEISCIYKRHGRTRKVHNLIFSPSLDSAARLSASLGKIGNIRSDGRPIIGLDSEKLLEMALEADERNFLVPAHAWTPHFSIFGKFSSFHTIEECFGSLAGHVRAIETGLSSDPPMNRRVSSLDNITLISNSDAHSPSKLAREANEISGEPSYDAIIHAITSGSPREFISTIEFFPEEGKYHFDGHRKCGMSFNPEETLKLGERCPACGGKLTVGVMSRVEELADRPVGYVHPGAVPFESLIPLEEVLSEVMGVGPKSKKVQNEYFRLVDKLGSELYIIRKESTERLEESGHDRFAEAVLKMRTGKVHIEPGFDGEYGKIRILYP